MDANAYKSLAKAYELMGEMTIIQDEQNKLMDMLQSDNAINNLREIMQRLDKLKERYEEVKVEIEEFDRNERNR